MNPYPTVNIVKEECIAHVTKRLKNTLMRFKRNTKEITYIHHKLSEPKAHYISSNYSTVIIQNRGKVHMPSHMPSQYFLPMLVEIMPPVQILKIVV